LRFEAFVRNIEEFVRRKGVDLVTFAKRQRKNDVAVTFGPRERYLPRGQIRGIASTFAPPQQPLSHAEFLTSGRGSPTNMARLGILIALRVLASTVASGGNSPLRLRI
jgi:hypothetical protein